MRYVQDALRGLVVSKVLASVSLQLTNVFLALHMITNGLKFEHVCWVYLLQSATRLVAWRPVVWMLGRGSLGGAFLVGYAAKALLAIALTMYIASAEVWSLVVLGMTFGVSTAFIGVTEAHHVAQRLDGSRKGKDISRLEIAAQAVSWLSPLLGGWLAAMRGQLWLGLFAACLAVLAVIPVWQGRGFNQATRVPPQQELHRLPWRDMWASAAWITQANAGMWLWYAYLAVIVPSFKMIGSTAAVSAIAGFLAMEFMGRLTDKYHWGVRMSLLVVVGAASFLGVARAGIAAEALAVTLPVGVVLAMLSVVTAANDTLNLLMQISWRVAYYARGAQYGLAYLSAIEFTMAFASVAFWALMGALASAGVGLSGMMGVTLLCCAVGMWLVPLIYVEQGKESAGRAKPLVNSVD